MAFRTTLRLLFALALHACTSSSPPKPARAFYYWRTTLSVSDAEQRALAELRIEKLYLRLFDVVPNAKGAPVATGVLHTPDTLVMSHLREVVPVVFLRNEVFEQMPTASTASLAAFVWDKALATLPSQDPSTLTSLHELQLDCDWTDATQRQFFYFVRALRKLVPSSVQLSATIRLHQVKFRERTGVPPVDRGMLMFYNMGRFDSAVSERAIFDAEIAKRYLERLDDYPLPLDVALPIWSWTLQLRDDHVVGLLQNTDPADLTRLDFISKRAEQRFEVSRTTFLHGQLLREGDVLKGEALNKKDLETAAELLTHHLGRAATPRTVALFDLSERNLNRHGLGVLEETLAALH